MTEQLFDLLLLVQLIGVTLLGVNREIGDETLFGDDAAWLELPNDKDMQFDLLGAIGCRRSDEKNGLLNALL